MSKFVAVRYLVPVYCTVDLNAEKPDGAVFYPDSAVRDVVQVDEEIQLRDYDTFQRIGQDHDPLTDAYVGDEWHSPSRLTREERAKAIEIAESTVWPAWERV